MRKENDDVCKGNISGPEEGGGGYIYPQEWPILPSNKNE